MIIYIRWLKLLLIGCVVASVTACELPVLLDDVTGTPNHQPTTHSPGQVGGDPAQQGGNVLSPEAVYNPPFEMGALLARNQTVYREFWGMTDQGYYTVQDFYHNGNKRTDPYTMVRFEELQTLLPEDFGSVVQQYDNLVKVGISIVGPYVQWYPNGQMAMSGYFENMIPSGEWNLYYESGTPMLRNTWRGGMLNGTSQGWHENGKLAGQGEYYNDQRQGIWTVWYPNGSKMQEGAYQNDLQDGTWVYWYDDGIKKEAGLYTNGVRVGMWTWWTRQGVLAREAEYGEDGELQGSGMGSGYIHSRP